MAFSLMRFCLVGILVYIPYVHGGYHPLEASNADYIFDLGTWFKPHIPQGWTQFGVLTMGKIDKTDLNPQSLDFNATDGNYAAFTPMKVTKKFKIHSEVQLAKAFKDMKKRFQDVKDVFIFTYWSPCSDCAQVLQNLAAANGQVNFHIGYNCTHLKKKALSTLDDTRKILTEGNIFFGDICHHQTFKRRKRDICHACELGKSLFSLFFVMFVQ